VCSSLGANNSGVGPVPIGFALASVWPEPVDGEIGLPD